MPPTELRVRMDPLNPGQFFACCGLLEIATLCDHRAAGYFIPDAHKLREAEFAISSESASIASLVDHLQNARFELRQTGEAATWPVQLHLPEITLTLDWWLDEFSERTTRLKCWAGNVTTENLITELMRLLPNIDRTEYLFTAACMTKTKFGVDPRSAWNALDFGFSPNEHNRRSAVFPAVELLAAIGLQSFRPDVTSRAKVPYVLWHDPLPASVARLAFRTPWNGLRIQRLQFAIQSRGQSYKYFTFANESPQEGEQE